MWSIFLRVSRRARTARRAVRRPNLADYGEVLRRCSDSVRVLSTGVPHMAKRELTDVPFTSDLEQPPYWPLVSSA